MLSRKTMWGSLAIIAIAATAAGTWAANGGVWFPPMQPEVEHEGLLVRPYSSSGHCGVERWSVKTGTDPDASKVNLNNPVNQTISYLIAQPAPNPPPSNARVVPIETTMFVVNATLVEYKLESDSDYHLVIKDTQGNTMITEIPDPACVSNSSPFASYIHNARSEFDAKYMATTSFKTANIPVALTGVGFFDFKHGQTGVAPNAIEQHPVLDVVFNPSGGGNNPPVANFGYTVNGLTANFTDSSTDSDGTITARAWTFGDGASSTATNPVHTYAASGSYNVALQVTDNGGATNTKTQSVAVSSGGGGGGSQLLGNPGFETGSAAPWSMSASVLCDSSCGESPHGGSYYAYLDGYGSSHTDIVSQSVTLPANLNSAALSFWLHIDTAETSTTMAYDTLKVQVFDTAGNLLGTVAQFSNLDHATGYQQHNVDMRAYGGKTVTLKFIGTEDYVDQTSFVLDDVNLNVQ